MKVLSAVLLIFALLGSVAASQVSDIENKLSCPCGCGMTVGTCIGAMSCTAAENISKEVQALAATGLDNNGIYAELVKSHGEQILASPTKKGFNLAAWLVPFFAIIAFGVFLFMRLKIWAGKHKVVQPAPKQQAGVQSDYENIFDEQFKEFESRS